MPGEGAVVPGGQFHHFDDILGFEFDLRGGWGLRQSEGDRLADGPARERSGHRLVGPQNEKKEARQVQNGDVVHARKGKLFPFGYRNRRDGGVVDPVLKGFRLPQRLGRLRNVEYPTHLLREEGDFFPMQKDMDSDDPGTPAF